VAGGRIRESAQSAQSADEVSYRTSTAGVTRKGGKGVKVVGQGISKSPNETSGLSCQPGGSHNVSGTGMRNKAEKDFTPYVKTALEVRRS
jgi:hypothetical protein